MIGTGIGMRIGMGIENLNEMEIGKFGPELGPDPEPGPAGKKAVE